MRHVDTGVASIGHFDNFCCWQFGDESSAHRDGIAIMLDEIRQQVAEFIRAKMAHSLA